MYVCEEIGLTVGSGYEKLIKDHCEQKGRI